MKTLVFFSAVLLSILVTGEGAKTVGGQECDSVCRRKGSKHWCHHSDGFIGWDYCTPDTERSDSTDVITTHGLKCIDACSRQGDEGARCNTVSFKYNLIPYDWDYCSPAPGLDYHGRACKDACEFRGKSYKWCNTASSEAANASEGMFASIWKFGGNVFDTVTSPFGSVAKNKWGYC